jgi:cell division protein FtsB
VSDDNVAELTEALSLALVQRGEFQAEVARLRDTETALRQVNAVYHAEVVDLQAKAAKLRAALEAIEWICFSDDKWICPWCSALDRVGHHADCARQVTLGL